MSDDPSGYYATLGVDPGAEPETIAAAFRRKARVLHPDVPGTGDAAAFIRAKAAYDVVGDVMRRGSYDRAARVAAMASPAAASADEPAPRWPRLSDLPLAVWAVLGGVLCFAVVMAVTQFSRFATPGLPAGPITRPHAPVQAVVAGPVDPPGIAPASGNSTHYVLPGRDAVLWRHDTASGAYRPAGHVAAFRPVEALGLVAEHGLVEIRLANGGSGFIDASRLASGDRSDARRAYCAYNAGLPPGNGELLGRHGDGTARIMIRNQARQPAVVRLRDASGSAVATVFIAPGGDAAIDNLPDAPYRPDFAVGELWSRACNGFTAGMRARRFAFLAAPSNLSPLVIPSDLSAAPASIDIADAAFERE